MTLPDWPRALGDPLAAVTLRTTTEDFVVEELLGFEPDGEGEHDLMLVEKTGGNTQWVARQLARHASVPPRDVGYCGLKDRHAITRQWYTVRRPRGGTDWSLFAEDGISLLAVAAHRKKLRRGSHRGNRFRIVARAGEPLPAERLSNRVAQLARRGFPNYFGEQRFGHDAGNLALAEALFAGRRLRREQRGFALSAARSFLFNEILALRVADGSWERLLDGERVNLDGSGSVFDVEAVDAELAARCERLDVHPTGTLWGAGAPLSSGPAALLEQRAVGPHGSLCGGLERAAKAEVRPLRQRVQRLSVDVRGTMAVFEFELPAGSFATSLLRELVEFSQASSSST